MTTVQAFAFEGALGGLILLALLVLALIAPAQPDDENHSGDYTGWGG